MTRWSNLKNNWKNRVDIECELLNKRCIDEFLTGFILGMLVNLLIATLSGCSNLEHNPKCSCDCSANKSHFECGGNVINTEVH